MKKHFPNLYISAEEKKDIWNNATFIFDTNILLNQYKYSIQTRDDVFKILDKIKERIWVPYQVGWEFMNNRVSKIEEQSHYYDTIINQFNNDKNKFFKDFDSIKNHPIIKIKEIEDLYDSFLKTVKEKIDKWRVSHPDYSDKDVVCETLLSLFDNKIGDDYEDKVLKDIYAEGAKRYEKQVPPGYKDLKEKQDKIERRLYGDLIIWKSMIDFSKEKDKDVIFVSCDVKEDWILKLNGKTISPQPALLNEFGKETGHRILIYDERRFIDYSHEYLGLNVAEETKQEVQDVQDFEAKHTVQVLDIETRRNLQKYFSKNIVPEDGLISSFHDPLEQLPLSEMYKDSMPLGFYQTNKNGFIGQGTIVSAYDPNQTKSYLESMYRKKED